jgi:hypothetical protein
VFPHFYNILGIISAAMNPKGKSSDPIYVVVDMMGRLKKRKAWVLCHLQEAV